MYVNICIFLVSLCLKVQTQVRDERRQHELDEIQNKPSVVAAAEGTGQSVVPCLDVGIEDFDINPGTTQRNRKRSVSSISLEEIEKHIGKPIRVAAASLNGEFITHM